MTPIVLPQLQYWIFDMDGTLTIANHDFPYMRRQLGMPTGQLDILAYLARQPQHIVDKAQAWLLDYEHQLAQQAQAAPGAVALIRHLHQSGKQLAILTRNNKQLARLTLENIGLLPYFHADAILGRDDTLPKPHPDGIHQLLQQWQTSAQHSIMVGDHYYDVQAGRNAGTHTMLINPEANHWPALSDHYFGDCMAVLQHLQRL